MNFSSPLLRRRGSPPVEFRDPTTGLATVNFWSSSVAVAPVATIVSHAWDVKDAVPATSAIAGTAVAPIAVVFNSTAPSYVTYTCTDSNGKTHTRYIPVLTPNRSGAGALYSQIEVTNLSGDVGSGGWLASLRVYGAADVSEFPDNAMVVLFARDFYGDILGSIGGQWTHRENIVFTGYIVHGTGKQSGATGAVEFEVEGVGVFAERLAALASTLVTAVAPTGWHELAGLSYNLACHHLLTQHSPLSNIADVNLGLLTYLDNAIDLTEGSLRGQLDQSLASIVRGQFGSSAQGMIYLQSDPQRLPVASRSNTAVISTQFVDLRDEIDLGDETMAREQSQEDFGGELTDNAAELSLS